MNSVQQDKTVAIQVSEGMSCLNRSLGKYLGNREIRRSGTTPEQAPPIPTFAQVNMPPPEGEQHAKAFQSGGSPFLEPLCALILFDSQPPGFNSQFWYCYSKSAWATTKLHRLDLDLIGKHYSLLYETSLQAKLLAFLFHPLRFQTNCAAQSVPQINCDGKKCSRHDFTKFSPCRYFDFTDSVQKQYEAGAFEPVNHEDRAFEAWLTSPETQAWLATDAVPPHPSQSAPSFMAPPRLFPPSPLLPPHPLNVSRGCLAPSAASVTAMVRHNASPRAPQNSYTLGPAAASSSSLPTTPSSSVPANRVDPKAEVWWWSENGQGAEVFDISVPHFPFFHPKDSTALVKFVGSQADVLDYAYWSGTRWTRTDIAVTVTGKTPLYLRSLNVSNCIDGPVAPVTPAKRKLSVVAGRSNSPSPQPSSQDHR
ncbi:hypothetical protein DFH06DRAFT_1131292 [Mycena polygramma]|nr:hypothetical protein DFH06DRAFT_1131292 [Mycena polygramma]